MHGFLLIDKPINMTSHDVLMKLKKKIEVKKIGHTGTLDPFATGLMIVCLGDACKLAHHFSGLDKVYEGTLVFGHQFDTLDTTGKIVDKTDVIPTFAALQEASKSLIKQKKQLPPMYAAIKVDGMKLYEYARKNIEVKVEERDIHIYDFIVDKQAEDQSYPFKTHVSKGTYVRAIARDLGALTNSYGALQSLRRLSVGRFLVENASTLDHLNFDLSFMSLHAYLDQFPSITLNDYLIRLVKNGVKLDERQIKTDQSFIVKNEEGNIIAYYEVTGIHQYKPVLIIKD